MKIRWTARSSRVQVPPPAPTSLCPRFEAEKTASHHDPAPAQAPARHSSVCREKADSSATQDGTIQAIGGKCCHLDSRNRAAVNDVLRTGDRASQRRGNKGNEVCHLFWLGRSSDRNAAEG